MNGHWKKTKLGAMLRTISRPVTLDPRISYRLLGAHWYAKGLYVKEEKKGSEICAKTLFVVEEGDFVYNRLFAWKGSFAVATKEASGCFVSNEFPCFTVNKKLVEPEFLWLYFSREIAWIEALGLSTGSTPTSRNRLKEPQFLNMEILLPPIEEQCRIVSRIEELAAKVEEARDLRKQSVEEVGALLASTWDVAFRPQPNWKEARVADFCENPQYGYTASATAEPVGPRLLRITDIQNGQVDWDQVPFCNCPNPEKYLLRENDLVFARTGATTGKSFLIRNCPPAVFASYLIRLRVKNLVSIEYLYKYFQSPSYWRQIVDEKKGTGQPNVNGRKLANVRVPVPPPDGLRHIVAYLDDLQTKMDSLKQLQSETAAELDALMPSILSRAFRGDL